MRRIGAVSLFTLIYGYKLWIVTKRMDTSR